MSSKKAVSENLQNLSKHTDDDVEGDLEEVLNELNLENQLLE